MPDILITNTTIVTVNPKREILYDGALAVTGDTITDIGPSPALEKKYSGVSKKIDGRGKAVFPGLINTHNHLFQTLLKGLGDDLVLSDWLKDMTFPSAVHLTEESCYYGAMIGCLDGFHSGTTTMLDYHYPHPANGHDDAIIQCFRELGLRGILGRGYMNAGIDHGVQQGITQDVKTIEQDARRLIETYHNKDNGRIRVWLAPAAVWSNDADSLKMTCRLMKEYNTGVTIHISETPFDRQASVDLHGAPDIDVCEKLGLMGPKLLMVHCVHLTPRDIRMTKYYDAKVSNNPVSNMYLSSGVPPIPALIEAGVSVGIGTDGAGSNNSNDMLEAMKTAVLLQKVSHRDPTIMTAEKVLEMATIDGARCLGMEDAIGSLETGKKADLFIFNPFRSAKAVPMHHPVSTLVYSSSQANVETLIVDGRILMEDGKVTVADEDAILKKADEAALALSERAGTLHLRKRRWRSLAY
ncbi:MAG: amidohydrolase [Treponema sp.]|nr:amidohydrolase [Treponema sp.]